MAGNMKSLAQEVAKAARRFHEQWTGHAPSAVTVLISEKSLEIMLHGALTPDEQALAAHPAGAAKVQKFHRQLFSSASEELREEIKRITGVGLRETAGVEPQSGAAIYAFPNGTMVQVFQLAKHLDTDAFNRVPLAARA